MWIQACGFTHSTFVTLPRSRTGFVASNSAAKAWCAAAGRGGTMKTRAKPRPKAERRTRRAGEGVLCMGVVLLAAVSRWEKATLAPAASAAAAAGLERLPHEGTRHLQPGFRTALGAALLAFGAEERVVVGAGAGRHAQPAAHAA